MCAASKGFADCRAVDGGAACIDFTLAAAAAASAPCGLLSRGSSRLAPQAHGATPAARTRESVAPRSRAALRARRAMTCAPSASDASGKMPDTPASVGRQGGDRSLWSEHRFILRSLCLARMRDRLLRSLWRRHAREAVAPTGISASSTCQRGLVCGSSATCGPPGGEGATCKSARDCASGVCGTDLKCAARRCSLH